jgi:hypothetical protein
MNILLRSCARAGYCDDERGFALASVLIIGALLSGFALVLLAMQRTVAYDAVAISSDIEMRAVAEAGLNRVLLAYLLRGDQLREMLVPDGRAVVWEFSGKSFVLRVQAC